MKKLDKFIFKAFIGPFFAILFVVLFILVMQFLWLYIDELVGKGLGLKVVAEFLMWGSCTILPLALPLATLLASMMTIGTLGENNELLAIKSSGTSLIRVFMPIIIASVFISIGAFFTSNDLVPLAYNKIFTLRDDIGNTKSEIKIPAGTFYDGIEGFIMRVDSNDEKTGMMRNVIVYDHSEGKGNISVTLADSALISMSKAKDYLIFTMYNGTNYSETNIYDREDTTLQLQKIQFDNQELIIPLHNYAFSKSDEERFGDQIKSMNLKELRHEKDSLSQLKVENKATYLIGMLTTPDIYKSFQFDTSYHATVPYPVAEKVSWNNVVKRMSAINNAKTKAEMLLSTVSTFSREAYQYTQLLRKADLEILKKYAGALACFILFFIGAPIGALIKKGGLGSSAIVSVLFFVLYWVVDISGTKLAKDGAISPFTGAFISAYVLAPLGAYLTWKAVKDSPFFGSDTIKNSMRKIWSNIKSFFRRTRIVYMGTPDFAVAPLDALIKRRFNIVGVVTVADKPSGRGLKLNESPVKKYAVEHGIPVLQPIKLKDPEFLDELRALKADIFVVVAFRMLPEEVWSMPKKGTFNLHAALLPQYRGAAPINWAVINGENITGVTTFMIDKDIDTGGIILRDDYRIPEGATAGDVHDALMDMGSELVVRTVEGIIENNIETRVQRSFIQGSEVLKPAPKLSKELCHIDWSDSTKHIYNLIRGLSPYPTAFTELVRDDQEPLQMKIFVADKMEMSEGNAGEIFTDGKNWLAIKTADGAISIKELQVSGKKRMPVKAFLLGFRDIETYSTTQGTSKEICSKVQS